MSILTRRHFVHSGALLAIAGAAALDSGRAGAQQQPSAAQALLPDQQFGFETVIRRAQELAKSDFRPRPEIPSGQPISDPERHKEIRFRGEKALWREEGLPFQLQMFHPGSFYRSPVLINIVDGRQITPLAFSRDLFDYGKSGVSELPADLGFAGFRIHAPMNVPTYFDEVAVFLGGSYFRALGKGQVYGLSARGVAIDTGLSKGEEFPFFREFWIEKPAKDATSITVYALLDGPSVTGGYRFVIRPGEATEVDVTNQIIARQDIRKLGIAPLTSMFLYGEEGSRRPDDYRPEVHDSDGLLLNTGGGEWIWRPLVNPRKLRISAYQLENPRGFGLIQRDRDFRDYEDLDALYHLRPSAWVEPKLPFGTGTVELIEIPAEDDRNDNIVAFWVPQAPLKAGQAVAFDYRVHWTRRMGSRPPEGRVVATRTTRATKPEARRFIVDFAGGRLSDIKSSEPIALVVNVSKGHIDGAVTQKNSVTGGWRAIFDLHPGDARMVELRAFLRLGEESLTETWSYQWSA